VPFVFIPPPQVFFPAPIGPIGPQVVAPQPVPPAPIAQVAPLNVVQPAPVAPQPLVAEVRSFVPPPTGSAGLADQPQTSRWRWLAVVVVLGAGTGLYITSQRRRSGSKP
jgi:hypothetical protein